MYGVHAQPITVQEIISAAARIQIEKLEEQMSQADEARKVRRAAKSKKQQKKKTEDLTAQGIDIEELKRSRIERNNARRAMKKCFRR